MSNSTPEQLDPSRDYSEEHIQTAEKLQHVRWRPTGYIVSTDTAGLVHIAQEPLANAIDELTNIGGKGFITVLMCHDSVRNTYQLVIKDTGRGVPIGKLMDSFTRLHTSAKFNTHAYRTSSGSFGIGAKATAGLSLYFRAITKRPEGIASIRVVRGEADNDLVVVNNAQIETGTVIVFEPDPTIFTDIEKFAETGYLELLLLIQKNCFFHPYNIEFKVHPIGLPVTIWEESPDTALQILDSYIHEAPRLIFTERTYDRTGWIKSYWNITRPFVWTHEIRNTIPSQTNFLEYYIKLYYARFEEGRRFGVVNDVPINDWRSDHISTVLDYLKTYFKPMIRDTAIRNFYVEMYKLPISIAVDVKYQGAEFTGTTKHAFTSKEFRVVYGGSLAVTFSQPENNMCLQELFEHLYSDIEMKYNAQIGNITKAKDLNRLFTELKYPRKFHDCNTSNRRQAELFIMEGDSAGSTSCRDAEYHAIYTIRGKPLNAVISPTGLSQSRIELQKDYIYHDIIKLLGINPSKPNMEELNFGSLIIATDADSDGYHICELLIGNLYILCPQLIEAGIIHIVTPPLYGVDISKKVKNERYMYFRDELELTTWMCRNVYMEAIDISIKSSGIFDKPKKLTDLEYVDFVKLILPIGDTINNIGHELVLDSQTIEALSYVTQYLQPPNVDIDRIKQILQLDRVTYDVHGHILILTKGQEDIIVPLQNVNERLYTTVIPALSTIAWKKLEIYITSKHTNVLRNVRVSVMQLYQLFRSADNMFKIKRYKGLGSMPDEDRVATCMDVKTRRTRRVTSVGDVDTIFAYLSTVDSSHRKKLLSRI